ncbi:MAG: hypothetical protein ACR2RL_25740 [Gammaproteobacteria bacterium]
MTPLDPRDAVWLRRGETLGRLLLQMSVAIGRAFNHVCFEARRTAMDKYVTNPAIECRDERTRAQALD